MGTHRFPLDAEGGPSRPATQHGFVEWEPEIVEWERTSLYVFPVLKVPVTSLLMTLTRHRVLSIEKPCVLIEATLAAPNIAAIVLVLAALLEPTEVMPHVSKHRHRHVVAPS